MEKLVSFQAAWEHFYTWMQSRRESGELQAIPKDVQEAQYAHNGKRRHPLGERRIKSLLLKYGQGRYRILEGVVLPD